jgi:hypothetical protein
MLFLRLKEGVLARDASRFTRIDRPHLFARVFLFWRRFAASLAKLLQKRGSGFGEGTPSCLV